MAKRVEEELERRREEIEAEVMRRVEEAKKAMEAQMLQEIERRKQEQLEEARKREVSGVKNPRTRLAHIRGLGEKNKEIFLQNSVTTISMAENRLIHSPYLIYDIN